MNFLKKQALNLSLLLATMAPLASNAKSDVETADKNKLELSGFANTSVRNGYYFTIGPLAGDRETSRLVNQMDFGVSIGNLTISTWASYAPLRNQIDEIDVIATYDLGSKEFKVASQPFTISGALGLMAFTYVKGSQAGDKTDILPNANFNISTILFGDKSTALNLFYMHNVVKDPVQNGGALMATLSQDVGKLGPVSISTNAYGAYGTDLYEFNDALLGRLGASASIDLTDNVSLSADVAKQWSTKDYASSIPNDWICGLTLSAKF